MNTEERIIFQNQHWKAGKFDTYEYKREIFGKIWEDIGTKLIAMITGPRRTGKSVIIKQLINELIQGKAVIPTQILFFEFSPGNTVESIWEIYKYFIKEIADKSQPVFLFFDEIQYVTGYESVIKEIYDIEAPKIFLTGSLSLSYKRRMEESLSGRFFHYRLFPLNFSEYLHLTSSGNLAIFEKAKKIENKFEKEHLLSILNPVFKKFLSFGRFPETVNFTADQAKSYAGNVLIQSLNQDAFSYFDIEKPQIINALFEYIRVNSGGLINILKLAGVLGCSAQTVKGYLDILEIMGLIYFVYNSTNSLYKLNTAKKAYVSSMFYLSETKLDLVTAYGFAVEAYILERLLEIGETVTFYRKRQKEIDFLLPRKKVAYEVKYRNKFDMPKGIKNYRLKVLSLDQDNPVCLF